MMHFKLTQALRKRDFAYHHDSPALRVATEIVAEPRRCDGREADFSRDFDTVYFLAIPRWRSRERATLSPSR